MSSAVISSSDPAVALPETEEKETTLSSPATASPERTPEKRASRWLSPKSITILALALWSVMLGIASLYLACPGYGTALFAAYLTEIPLLVLNLLPVLVVVLLFYLLSCRVWISTLLSSILVLVPTIVNYMKLSFRGDPLMASDIAYLSEAAQMSTRYSLTRSLLLPVILICCAALALTVAAFFLPKVRCEFLPRLVASALLLIWSAILYSGVYLSDAVYLETQNTDITLSNDVIMSVWSDTDRYVCHGFLYPFLHSFSTFKENVPTGYHASTAKEAFNSYTYTDIPEEQKVNIVSIMLEAYNDFSAFDGITFEVDPYEALHAIQAESWSGTLVTNIFAGGTITTENAFLTGNIRNYTYRKNAGSFVRYFGDQGYTTVFAHPSYAWFYNRANVSEYLGFDGAFFYENRYSTDSGNIYIDEEFFADLITLYEEGTANGNPYFNFSVTYQNHGPYVADTMYSSTEYISREGLSEESYNIFNNYLAGIASTNAELANLVEYFRTVEEPVVLIFFGDHNPWLGDNASVYKDLDINLNLNQDEGFYNYYSTPYVIWANDTAKEILGNDFVGDGGSLSPCFLMSEFFSLCGWSGDEFMQANMELKAYADVVSTTGRVRIVEDGILTETIPQYLRDLLDRYYEMEYYRKQDLY